MYRWPWFLFKAGAEAVTFLQRITDRQAVLAARLSYDQIKSWRKDFDKLVTVMMSVDFKTVAEALKGYKEIGVKFPIENADK